MASLVRPGFADCPSGGAAKGRPTDARRNDGDCGSERRNPYHAGMVAGVYGYVNSTCPGPPVLVSGVTANSRPIETIAILGHLGRDDPRIRRRERLRYGVGPARRSKVLRDGDGVRTRRPRRNTRTRRRPAFSQTPLRRFSRSSASIPEFELIEKDIPAIGSPPLDSKSIGGVGVLDIQEQADRQFAGSR